MSKFTFHYVEADYSNYENSRSSMIFLYKIILIQDFFLEQPLLGPTGSLFERLFFIRMIGQLPTSNYDNL